MFILNLSVSQKEDKVVKIVYKIHKKTHDELFELQITFEFLLELNQIQNSKYYLILFKLKIIESDVFSSFVII